LDVCMWIPFRPYCRAVRRGFKGELGDDRELAHGGGCVG
jgi:hypothetical protein